MSEPWDDNDGEYWLDRALDDAAAYGAEDGEPPDGPTGDFVRWAFTPYQDTVCLTAHGWWAMTHDGEWTGPHRAFIDARCVVDMEHTAGSNPDPWEET